MADIYTIRMALPAKNAIDPDLIEWLSAELDAAASRPVLLTGSEGAFCAGLNLKRVAELDAAGMEAFLRSFDALVHKLFLYPAPVVASVNGHAIAGGCVLALACDHRVAADEPRVRIGLNEIALGACFPPVTLRMVRHRLSPRVVESVLLGAGLHDPVAARDMGLVDELSDEPESVALDRLAALARHPREVYAHTKRVLRAASIELDEADERRFVDVELGHWTSDETRERVQSVLAGR